MKHRDISLFTVPLVFTALLILAAWLLFGQISRFESSYRTQAIRDIKIETKLLTQIISPKLENNLLEEAQQYIQKFSDEHLRITLIDSNGNVGEIGGVEYKLKGAVNEKSDIFFVPMGNNYDECLKIKKEKKYDIVIVGISKIDDAIEYLENLKN